MTTLQSIGMLLAAHREKVGKVVLNDSAKLGTQEQSTADVVGFCSLLLPAVDPYA